MYIITVRRITSGELLKYRKGFCIAGSYGMLRPGSSRFSLTMPFASVHASIHNHFNQDRRLNRRDIFQQNRAAALAEWCEPMA